MEISALLSDGAESENQEEVQAESENQEEQIVAEVENTNLESSNEAQEGLEPTEN